MSKVLIFSDIHIHPHKCSTERLRDCLKTIRWIFDSAVERNIKNILFLGDLLHDRNKIDVPTYQWLFDAFGEYLGGPNPPFNLYLLLGNHDMWQYKKWDISSVKPFSVFPTVTVIDKPCTLQIDGHPVSFLPYTTDPDKDVKELKNDGEFKILCGHVALNGALLNVMYGIESDFIEHDSDMKKIDAEVFDGWNQVFLGHYHAHQILGLRQNVEYVGSPLQLSFGEAFQHKHVLVYDLETHEKEYLKNKFSPQHFIIPEEDISKYELNGNFIRVTVEDLGKSDVIELHNKLNKDHKVGSLKIIQKNAKSVVNDVDMVESAKAILLDDSQMLESFIEAYEKQNGLGTLTRIKLIEIGKKICEMRKKA